MKKNKIDAISHLLTQKESLITAKVGSFVNKKQLDDFFFQQELNMELQAITTLLAVPETFEETFLLRCQLRQKQTESFIPIAAYPESLANQLYWDIAILVFQPATLGAMIAILMPDIKRVIEISPVKVRESSLDNLYGSPDSKALNHMVFSESRALYLPNIPEMTYEQLIPLIRKIEGIDSQLAERLFQHNATLHDVKTELEIIENPHQTPQQSTEILLRNTLQNSDKKYSWLPKALHHIQIYCAQTPQTQQKPSDFKRIITIINEAIISKNLVPISDKFKIIVEELETLPLQIFSPASEDEEFTKKEVVIEWPLHFLLNQLGKLASTNPESFIATLQITPPIIKLLMLLPYNGPNDMGDLPTSVANSIIYSEDAATFDLLADPLIIRDVLVLCKPQHRLAIIQKFYAQGHYFLHDLIQDNLLGLFAEIMNLLTLDEQRVLIKVIDARGIELFEEMLPIASMRTFLLNLFHNLDEEAILAVDGFGKNWLHFAVADTEWLNDLLVQIHDRVQALGSLDNDGNNVLHAAAQSNAPSTQMVLNYFTELSDKLRMLNANRHGMTPAHFAASNVQILSILLFSIPHLEQQTLIHKKNNRGYTLLHWVAPYPQSLQLTLQALTPENRIPSVETIIPCLSCNVLHLAARNEQSLAIVLNLYPTKEQKKQALEATAMEGCVLHFAISNPLSVALILKSYDEDERFNQIASFDCVSSSFIHKVTAHPDSLDMTLCLLPDPDRPGTLDLFNIHKQSPLHIAASSYPQSLSIYFKYIRSIYWFKRLKNMDDFGCTILEATLTQTPLMLIILQELTEQQRFEILHTKLHYGLLYESHLSVSPLHIENSFVGSYLRIRYELQAYGRYTIGIKQTFGSEEHFKKLVGLLNQAKSFAQLQESLIEYLSDNEHAPFSRLLLKLFLGKTQDYSVRNLKTQWQVDENSGFELECV